MNKKIIGMIVTFLLCAVIVTVGVLAVHRNINAAESIPEETSAVSAFIETSAAASSETTSPENGGIIFDTKPVIVTEAPAEVAGSEPTSSGGRIYADDDDVFSGGYFQWR